MDARRYPFELVETASLPDGQSLLLRPIHPQDGELLQAFVRGLSPRTRYLRFQNGVRELSAEMLRRATHVDYRRHMALVAESFAGGAEALVAAARYVAGPQPDEAEFALVVADDWQGRGIGARLLRRLCEIAADRGIARLRGEVLHGNEPMLALARSRGFAAHSEPGDARILTVSKSLAPPVLARAA